MSQTVHSSLSSNRASTFEYQAGTTHVESPAHLLAVSEDKDVL